MRTIRITTVVILAVLFAAAATHAASLDEVIAKHLAAKGGDRWHEVESIKLTGAFTAFSVTQTFTEHRKRGAKHHSEVGFLDSVLRSGFDGATGWEDAGDGPRRLEGLELAIALREADFGTPFLRYQERGYKAKLLENAEFDGMPAIGIELDRGDGHEETWYLDPGTHLEMGRVSPGSDWLGPVVRTTYYDDFRTVDGLVIPFYVESQWYTRNRIFDVENVETGVPVDDGLFGIPLPPGMDRLQPLVGEWAVALETRQQPGQDWQPSERRSTIESHLSDGLLQERFETAGGVGVVRTLSYDRYRETYRMTQIDGRRAHLNVLEGAFDDDPKLIVSNVETGTTWSGFGMTFHGRITIHDIGENGFKLDHETSIDGGENWFLDAKAVYTRSEDR